MPQDYGGGFSSLIYSLSAALKSRRPAEFARRMMSRNACKSCALGMGGAKGGLRDEAGRFPEGCKKSVQAMAADMAPPIDPEFFSSLTLADLRNMSSSELEKLGRFAQPFYAKKGATRYKAISWDAAFDKVADALKQHKPGAAAFYSSGRSSNEAAFLFQCFARSYGTNNINNCSFYCHQASSVGLGASIGVGTSTVSMEDLDKADFAMVFGANPASNHPRLVARLAELRKRGGKVVVVNPMREPGLERFRIPSKPVSLLFASRVSDLYLQPIIGGDIALIAGMLKCLIEARSIDAGFIERRTEGWEDLERAVQALDWSDIERDSGVERGAIQEGAWMFGAARDAILMWGMGVTQHAHGVDNVMAIANLALSRGMAGRPSAGLLPIRGHSNVQGVSSMGATPALKKEFADRLAERYGISAGSAPGLDTLAMTEAAAEGKLNTILFLGGNLHGASPDVDFYEKAMSKVGLTVFLSTKPNTGHFRGMGKSSLILPVRVRDEEIQPTTQESMFNYVRVSNGGFAGPPGAMTEVEVVSELAARTLGTGRFDWRRLRNHSEIYLMIAETVPGYSRIKDISVTRQEFHVEGRIQNSPAFSTANGRARFHNVEIPRFDLPEDAWRLMTVRSEGQFNTVVYEDEDIYRGQSERLVILLNARDAHLKGIHENSLVKVESEAGAIKNVRVRLFDIAPRCAAMYFPEANLLIPRTCDSASKTPSFKNVTVKITQMPA